MRPGCALRANPGWRGFWARGDAVVRLMACTQPYTTFAARHALALEYGLGIHAYECTVAAMR